MASERLHRALTESALRPLPDRAAALLESLAAPPRLAAHLRAVHDVAHQLADWVERHHPSVAFDRPAVLFGAATHDIGKVTCVEELSGPGSLHEPVGYELLLAHGVEDELARFARDHASWTKPGIRFEDLLVSLADKVWKAKRVTDLEQLVVDHLANASGQEGWGWSRTRRLVPRCQLVSPAGAGPSVALTAPVSVVPSLRKRWVVPRRSTVCSRCRYLPRAGGDLSGRALAFESERRARTGVNIHRVCGGCRFGHRVDSP